ncbi:MAG: chemotaxis-specific protein-glutamate methyltransferase CheB [Acidobacteriota bacterium]
MSTIRLAVVDDSAFVRKAIKRMLEADERVEIVGLASTGEELLENLKTWRPDIVALDLCMPGMGGLMTLPYILEWKRIPVIIMSTHSGKETRMAIEALHRGAIDFIDKQQYSLVDFHRSRAVLLEKILSLTRGPDDSGGKVEEPAAHDESYRAETRLMGDLRYEALFIGASTGGPPAIQKILEELGPLPKMPIAVVQHMPEGFTKAFADRLNAHLPFRVQEARHAEVFRPGTAYIGPTGHHLRIKRDVNTFYTVLTKFPDTLTHRPAVDILFESAAQAYGAKACAVLLTGMGRDGAAGMAELAKEGAYTIAEDESTCVVNGMPKAAVQIGAVRQVLPLNRIARRIADLFAPQEPGGRGAEESSIEP